MGLAPGSHPDGTLGGAGGIAAWGASSSEDFKASLAGQVAGSTTGILSFGVSARGAVNAIPELTDGQTALEGRADLLDGARGYLHLIQSKNWNCPRGGSAKKLPFDVQVGPSKGASPSSGGIRLLEKGLWRADMVNCWQPTITTSGEASPYYSVSILAVHKVSNGELFTRKHFYKNHLGTVDPESVIHAHEFVIPEDNAYDVSVWVGFTSETATALPLSTRKLYGGIQYTGLWATKVDSGTTNAQPGETVTDGGTLS